MDDLLTRHKTHLWASLPCRPWSQWNALNGRKLGKFRAYVEALREESLELISVFMNLASKVIKAGAWLFRVASLLRRMGCS